MLLVLAWKGLQLPADPALYKNKILMAGAP